ncbi:YbaB/EbfC family nucleoid-associated protein [Actinomadura rubrisoli]|uniref:YbaB/EbfC family nucleoid-associated protein n=1 Tax=Actinomadura rubrisoli TaxID=2530368 RepID=UPI001404EFBC|nr:YbaB/EbfC family nucleoid-associated protein [Actinomadura rubrisoli]
MDELKDTLGFDPEKLAKDADAFFGQLRDMHAAGTAVTTRAESADQRVAVEYSSSEGVRALHIDPRAMRAGAQELATTILDLIRQAQREAESEGQERLTELLGRDNSLISDRDSIGRELRNATGAVQENLATATETLDRLQSVLRR